EVFLQGTTQVRGHAVLGDLPLHDELDVTNLVFARQRGGAAGPALGVRAHRVDVDEHELPEARTDEFDRGAFDGGRGREAVVRAGAGRVHHGQRQGEEGGGDQAGGRRGVAMLLHVTAVRGSGW